MNDDAVPKLAACLLFEFLPTKFFIILFQLNHFRLFCFESTLFILNSQLVRWVFSCIPILFQYAVKIQSIAVVFLSLAFSVTIQESLLFCLKKLMNSSK